MRWPLKLQIGLPMAAVMLLGVATASGLNAYLAAHGTRGRIEGQLRDVSAIVTKTNFPLTGSVLAQLRGLSGAHFVLADASGNMIATSTPGLPLGAVLPTDPRGSSSELSLEHVLEVGEERYFHSRVSARPAGLAGQSGVLHILYPVADYEAAWQRAVYPSLGVLVVALPAIVLLSIATAARIGRRTVRLQRQLRRIADGDFREAPLPNRDDELRDLAKGVNRTAAMLATYEDTVRKSEKMQTLAQLGGGMAHQLRNSLTGCRLAIDFHAQDCPLAAEDESLEVARRQLALMEEYVRRFLQLSKGDSRGELVSLDLRDVVEDVLPLVGPAARHAGVQLDWQPPPAPACVRADRVELCQLLINLITNAIEAASRPVVRNGSPPQVRISIERPSDTLVQLEVIDSGPGPGEKVRQRLFDPFVSEKVDGVGLGLSVVQAIARQHGAEVNWERADGWTHFRVEFPAEAVVIEANGETACPNFS